MAGKVDFMVIGAMKCGTTTLTTELSIHPQVGFSNPKEPDFFIKKNWRELLASYETLFPRNKDLLLGEGSTSYTKRPVITPGYLVEDLYEYNSNLKFIYIMRDPIERLISHYRYNVSHGAELPKFEEAIRTRDHLVDVGRYYYQIEPFITRFGRDRILLLTLEQYQLNRDTLLKRVADFLGIDPSKFGSRAVHQGNSAITTNTKWERLLSSQIGQGVKQLVPRRLRFPIKQGVTRILGKKADRITVNLSPSVRSFLVETYSDDVRQIAQLMDGSSIPWEGWGGEGEKVRS